MLTVGQPRQPTKMTPSLLHLRSASLVEYVLRRVFWAHVFHPQPFLVSLGVGVFSEPSVWREEPPKLPQWSVFQVPLPGKPGLQKVPHGL